MSEAFESTSSTVEYRRPDTPQPRAGVGRRTLALVVVSVILLTGALGLNYAAAFMQVTFQKEPVALRQPVAAIPSEVGPWVQVTVDTRMSHEIEEALGTLEYIQRTYIDTRKADPAIVERWRKAEVKSESLRNELQASAVSNDPLAAVTLHVAYYTGGVDTVPHIPDRCMVAGGYSPVGREAVSLDLGQRQMPVSFVQFQQSAGHARPTTLSVAYFFQVNGDYEYDAITGVRKRLQNLFERYAYFAKIECMTASTDPSAAPAQAAMADFLSHALPAVEEVLPDWEQVTSGEAPEISPEAVSPTAASVE